MLKKISYETINFTQRYTEEHKGFVFEVMEN